MIGVSQPAADGNGATDLLINRLCADLRPADSARTANGLGAALLAALGVTAVLVLGVLGTRADLAQAITGPIFWLKISVMAWLAGGAWLVVRRLGTPGTTPCGFAPLLAPPIALLVAAALSQHAGDFGAAFWLGSSWRRCSLTIALLAAVPLILLLHALARLAPTDRRRAGLVAGVAAGGLAAALYSLSCGETSTGFVLLWYGLGVAAPALAGWALGPALLRW